MQQFMPEVAPAQRAMLLEQNADRVEETTYYRALTPDELDLKREKLTDNAIRISELDDEKKGIMDDLKNRTKPLLDENRIIMQEVKRKQIEVTGKLYHMKNYDDGLMYTYDEQGEFVSSRRLRPDEKQATIFNPLFKAQ